MLTASPRTLKLFAAITWHVGAFVLLIKGADLFQEASLLDPHRGWIRPAIAVGLGLGVVKGLTLFRRSCSANLARIEMLEQPRPWDFFRPRFFILLSLMILTGATLSHLAHGNYGFLVPVAVLDLSIGSALLLSSAGFWRQAR